MLKWSWVEFLSCLDFVFGNGGGGGGCGHGSHGGVGRDTRVVGGAGKENALKTSSDGKAWLGLKAPASLKLRPDFQRKLRLGSGPGLPHKN
jgi:hypothetical protein